MIYIIILAIGVLGALLLEATTVASEIAQVTLGLRRDKRRFEQPMLQEVSNVGWGPSAFSCCQVRFL